MQSKLKFNGDTKEGIWLLQKLEDRLRAYLVPKVPKQVETYHLTLLTIVWSIGIVLSGYLSTQNLLWLHLSSVCIFLQYITDLLDGAIGRSRNTGLIKWGFFMDHLLDYVFMCSIIAAYSFILLVEPIWLIAALSLGGIFMIQSFLYFACTNTFKISVAGFGPTESRIAFILLNTMIIVLGADVMAAVLPYIVSIGAIFASIHVYKTSKELWYLDLKHHES